MVSPVDPRVSAFPSEFNPNALAVSEILNPRMDILAPSTVAVGASEMVEAEIVTAAPTPGIRD
jgi:hypothetical protein